MELRQPEDPGARSRRGFLRGLVAGAAYASAASDAVARPSADSLGALREAAALAEPELWARVREEFFQTDGPVYMNNGTLGPTPKPVYQTLVERYRELALDPGESNASQEQAAEEVRRRAAAFVGAEPDEIALTRNTTEGMNFVAHGLELQAGDEVLMTFHEHPGGLQPWRLRAKRSGIVLKPIRFPIPTPDPAAILNLFAEAITPRTRVISVSHVTYQTGSMVPVRELTALARARGILSLVDGAHPLGMLKLDMHQLGADFYAMSPHKWLNAPSGTGLLYVRREAQERLWPTLVTSSTPAAGQPFDWENPARGAARFDRLSQRAWPLVLASGAALEFQAAIGRERIEKRVRALADGLCAALRQMDGVRVLSSEHPELHCGLTGFELDGFTNKDVVETLLRRHGLRVRHTGDGFNTVRVSTHYYNSEAQLARLIEGLIDIQRNGVTPAPSAGDRDD